ncbi:MAG: hypothetical protein GC160_11530 [Acidobacteria bacterium]|nr:hypothetical protein [Acidobacteriota bacterium]
MRTIRLGFTAFLAVLASVAPALAQAVLTNVSPNQSYPPCAAITLTLSGQNFSSSSVVLLGETLIDSTYVNDAQMTATLESADLATPGTVDLAVENPDEPLSNTLPFAIRPTPLTAMQPTSAVAGSGGFTLTVQGDCFEPGATVLWNGQGLTTTFQSATTLTAAVPAGNVAAVGSANVTVSNANGNTSTTALPFQVNNNPPVLQSVSPTSSGPPCAPFTLTATGQNFVSGSKIKLGSTVLNTTLVNATTLTATVTAAALATPGPTSVLVQTTGLPDTSAVSFTVGATPFTSMQPNTATAGSTGVTVIVQGSCFQQGATVLWNGQSVPTTFLSATALQANVPAGNLTTPTTATITVRNANGNTSGGLPFVVAQPTAPLIESVRPSASYPPCAPFDIIVVGQHLPFDGVIELGGTALATVPGNGGQLIGTVTSAALATPGASQVVVKTGQVTSNAFPFTIGATPFTTMQPGSATVGSGPVDLAVQGDCFEQGATVLWNGQPLATTFGAVNRLSAVIPAANLATAGVGVVTIRNANGNTSGPIQFTISAPSAGPPTITTLAPPSLIAGSGAATIAIHGSNFDSQATVRFGGVAAAKTSVQWLNASQMNLTLSATQTTLAGVTPVEVENPDGQRSNAVNLRILPTITNLAPTVWTIGGPCELLVAGRGFRPESVLLLDGFNGPVRLDPTAPASPTLMTVCLPPGEVDQPGTVQVSVCSGSGTAEVCSSPVPLDVVENPLDLQITALRPMSATAGSGSMCLAIDVSAAGGDPGALEARWDGAALGPATSACPPAASLSREWSGQTSAPFQTTVLVELTPALLARERPRDATVACAADPLAPKVTVAAPSAQLVSAPACFDIQPLIPTTNPPTTSVGPNGCTVITITGANIHESAEIVVDGLEGGFCTGGEPRISDCSTDAAGSSICSRIDLSIPPGSAPGGSVTIRIRNPAEVCSTCADQTVVVPVEPELAPKDLTLSCPTDGGVGGPTSGEVAFARTAVGDNSRLRCVVLNGGSGPGRVGALAIDQPFVVEPSDCGDAVLEPGQNCGFDLIFTPPRPGLFTATLQTGGAGSPLAHYAGVGVLRSATVLVLGGSLGSAAQSTVRVEAEGASGAEVDVLLRQSLRLAPQVTVFPINPAATGAAPSSKPPEIDCGFPAAVVGAPYRQPLVAACDTAGASWRMEPLDGGDWLTVEGDALTGVPTETGVYSFRLDLLGGFPGGQAGAASSSRTCSVTVIDAATANGAVSGDVPVAPCTTAQWAAGGVRQRLPLGPDGSVEAAFQTGTVAGTLRYVATFEADGVDVSPAEGGALDAPIPTGPPVIDSATFSCASATQLTVEATGYSNTREVASMRFAFQAAPGSSATIELGGDAATRPDLVQAFQGRFADTSGTQKRTGGFLLRAIFNVSGRAADVGGVSLTLSNAAGSVTAAAGAGAPACSTFSN